MSALAPVADEHVVLVGDGGLSRGEVLAILEAGFSPFTLAGASITAYDPGYDVDGRLAEIQIALATATA